MKNLMMLFEFELRRNIKNYFLIIVSSCSFVLLNLIRNLNDYNYVIENVVKNESLSKVKDISDTVKIMGFSSFSNIIYSTKVWFLFGLILCIFYAFFIWHRDFDGKNKSIYTLAMIPNNRINIYISKLLNIIFLVYSYTLIFIITLFISSKVLPNYMLGGIIDYGFLQSTMYELNILIPYSIEILLVEYVFLLIGAVSVIFTSILINKSINRFGYFIGFIFIVVIVMIFVLGIKFNSYKDINLIIVLYSSISIIICSFLSNKLLNDKIDF